MLRLSMRAETSKTDLLEPCDYTNYAFNDFIPKNLAEEWFFQLLTIHEANSQVCGTNCPVSILKRHSVYTWAETILCEKELLSRSS